MQWIYADLNQTAIQGKTNFQFSVSGFILPLQNVFSLTIIIRIYPLNPRHPRSITFDCASD
jgi:hypothetical protein